MEDSESVTSTQIALETDDDLSNFEVLSSSDTDFSKQNTRKLCPFCLVYTRGNLQRHQRTRACKAQRQLNVLQKLVENLEFRS